LKKLTRTIPPLRGPNPQGLNVPLKQVKTIRLDKKPNNIMTQEMKGWKK
jgi:hypothetical protein